MRDKDEKRWGRTLRQRAREEQRKNHWGGTTKWSSDRRAVKLDCGQGSKMSVRSLLRRQKGQSETTTREFVTQADHP